MSRRTDIWKWARAAKCQITSEQVADKFNVQKKGHTLIAIT
jgi:hypothetical protein